MGGGVCVSVHVSVCARGSVCVSMRMCAHVRVCVCVTGSGCVSSTPPPRRSHDLQEGFWGVWGAGGACKWLSEQVWGAGAQG